MQSWTIKNYLKSQVIQIVFFSISFILVTTFLVQTIENTQIIIFCALLLFVVFMSGLLIDYFRKSKFYNQVINYEFKDDLEVNANFEEAKLMNHTLHRLFKQSIEEIEALHNIQTEYTQYIESWVHEIKTPIAAAKLMCDNLNDERLSYELSNIEDYVEQAMFYAKSSHVESDYLLKNYQLEDLVKQCIRKNKRYFILYGVHVGLVDCDALVLSDEKWILFIMDQIVRNAIKYSNKKDCVDFICVTHKNSIELQIRDYGVGIRSEDIPRIFDKGFTGENGRNKDTHASGLGLYLAKRFANDLYHELTVNSIEGNTVFSLWFPLDIERLHMESNNIVS